MTVLLEWLTALLEYLDHHAGMNTFSLYPLNQPLCESGEGDKCPKEVKTITPRWKCIALGSTSGEAWNNFEW